MMGVIAPNILLSFNDLRITSGPIPLISPIVIPTFKFFVPLITYVGFFILFRKIIALNGIANICFLFQIVLD